MGGTESAVGSPAGSRPTPPPGILGAARAMAIDRVTGEVVTALEGAGIPCILLKGPSIARWLYPQGGRTYCDTDLLVRASDHPRAAQLLVSLGFEDRFAGFSPYERRLFEAGATSYVRPGQLVANIDLHRNMPGLPTPDDVLWGVLSARTVTLPVGGRDVRILDRTGVGLHVVVHAVQSGFRLHTDEDLRRLIAAASPAEWEAVAALAARLGISDVLGHGLRHSAAGAEVADRLGLPETPVAESPYRWALLGGPRGAGSLLKLQKAPSWPEQLRSIRWMVLPSPAKVRYVTRRPDARGLALAGAYGRWWLDLARAGVPAARFARRRPVYPANG